MCDRAAPCLAIALLVASAAVAQPAQAQTRTAAFSYAGAEQTFIDPGGVFSIGVLAIGGRGGGSGAPGGAGAQVSGDLKVTPGETLYVEVGGNGGPATAGFNGGGAAVRGDGNDRDQGAGGGGGASDVRSAPRSQALSVDDRLLVASGGGGGGESGERGGGAGGAAGEPGQNVADGNNFGGGAGTQTAGGAAGVGGCHQGEAGALGVGGSGGDVASGAPVCWSEGGGGGGGYYGGGGGGAGGSDAGGGGGGGSSLVPEGGSSEIAPGGAEPEVQITYTRPPGPETLMGSVSEVTQTSALLNATVNPEGANVTTCAFEYGPAPSYGSSVPCKSSPGSGSSAVSVSAVVSGLVADSSYHARVVATSSAGTDYSPDYILHTLPNPPTAVTGPASELAPSSAMMNATVNPEDGIVTACRFEYGTKPDYGNTVPCRSLPPRATTPQAVSASLVGLSTDVTYHFRVVATSAEGTSYGSDETFALPGTAAPATAGWLAPLELVPEAKYSTGQQVGTDARGDATVIWETCCAQSVVQATARPAGGNWQLPITLSEMGRPPWEPDIAVAPDGEAVAVWDNWDSGQGTIQSASRPAGGSWQPSVTLSEPGAPGESAWLPKVAVDPRGDAIVVWQRSNSSGDDIIQSSFRAADGAWEKPVNLSEAGENANAAQVALDPNGDAVAVWNRFNGSNWVVQSASRPSGGTWQQPVHLSEGGDSSEGPQVAVDPRGDAAAVWEHHTEGGELIQGTSRPAGGSWQEPVNLSEPAENTLEPHIGLDAAGDAVMTWERSYDGGEIIQTSYKPAGGSWQQAVNLSAPGASAYRQHVSVDPRGEAVAIWELCCAAEDAVQASVKHPGGYWQGPVTLSEPGVSVTSPEVAMDPLGDAVAVWGRDNNRGADTVQSAGYDGAGPQLNGLSVPSAGVAGEPVSFSVAPLSVWSTVAETTWRFGDGSSASGTDVTHVYAKAGTYQVTLESEDALGNRTTSSGAISIAPRIERPQYKGWELSGMLTPKKLAQPIALPEGSTFNGSGELNTEDGAGSVSGEVSIPPFTTTTKLFGLLPLRLGITLTPAAPVEGSIAPSNSVPGEEALTIPVQLGVAITSVGVLGLTIPTKCSTTEPMTLDPTDTLTREELLAAGWSFAGTTTIPQFTCEGGLLGSAFGEVLSAFISGPGNAYTLNVAAPPV